MSILACDPTSSRQATKDSLNDPLNVAYQANLFLRTALDQASEGIMILQPFFDEDIGPKVLLGNTKLAAMIGVDPQVGLRGQHLLQIVATQNEGHELLQAMQKAAAQGGAGQWEGDLKTAYGVGHKRCQWRIRAVQDDHGRLQNYTLTVSPVAAAQSFVPKHMSSIEADDTRRLRNDNLASLSLGVLHDLNNLLGIMMTNLSIVARLAEKDEEISRHVEESLAAAHQAREFTTQTMRMAKDLPEHKEAIEITKLIRETARVSQSGSGVKLHLHLPKDLWWSVVDRVKITQVVQNLIINGIQAMKNCGYMDVIARNVIVPAGHSLLPQGPHVEILVRDRGCGMTPDVLEKVLKEGYTTKPNGNGIGLTTCRRIIEEHSGKLNISSMKDIGTEVTFWLPATRPQLVPVTAAKPQRPVLMEGAGSILVVDDEPRLRKVVVSVLKQCGYRVYEAESGEEAVTAYRHLMRHNDEVDLVIMDLTLKGGLTGEDALNEIKALNSEAKIIASSGGLVDETRQQYMDLGFCDILPKPYLAPDISVIVHRHVMQERTKRAQKAWAA